MPLSFLDCKSKNKKEKKSVGLSSRASRWKDSLGAVRGQLNNSALHSFRLLSNPVADTCRDRCGDHSANPLLNPINLIFALFVVTFRSKGRVGQARSPQVRNRTIDFLTSLSPRKYALCLVVEVFLYNSSLSMSVALNKTLAGATKGASTIAIQRKPKSRSKSQF